MYISRPIAGTLLLLTLIFANIVAATDRALSSAVWPLVLLILFEIVLIPVLLRWVAASSHEQQPSKRKVVAHLDRFDPQAWDAPRSRLMRDEAEVEYQSMAELVQFGKRKNELR